MILHAGKKMKGFATTRKVDGRGGVRTPHAMGVGLLLLLLMATFAMPAYAKRIARGVEAEREMRFQARRDSAIGVLVHSPSIDSTAFAMLVVNLSNGRTIAQYHPDRPLIPASIMKSLTIATLIREKGPDWRYDTKVYLEGHVKDGVLDGNLVVMGSGDPTINSVSEPKTPDFVREIVDALKNKKIEEIRGRIVIDERDFAGPATPPSWGRGDLSRSYGTGSHGFNYRNNASGKSAVTNPGAVFTAELKSALAKEGISVVGESLEVGGQKLLMTHRSAPLEEIMRSCMMRSDNLFAEMLLRTYSHSIGKDGSTEEGAKAETDYWHRRHMPMQDVRIIDGSGLSRQNRLTPRFLSDVLREMSEDVEYASFFPLAGQEGTLRGFMKGSRLDSYLAMKTGSMNGVQCYAGYMLDDDFAPTHAIVVMCNNMRDRAGFRKALGNALLVVFDGQ